MRTGKEDWNYESRRMKGNDLFFSPRHTFSWGTEGNERGT